jgi:hypothetical protein
MIGTSLDAVDLTLGADPESSGRHFNDTLRRIHPEGAQVPGDALLV